MANRVKPPAGSVSISARVVGTFAGGNLVATMLRMVGGVLTSRVIEPAVLGQYNALGLVVGYAPFLQIGVNNGLNRELPYLFGKEDRAQAIELATAAQAWSLLTASLAALALLCIGLWQLLQGRSDLAAGWATFAVVVFGGLFGQGYLHALFRTSSEFVRLAHIGVVDAIVAVLLVAFVWLLGWWGLCLRGLLLALTSLALLWFLRPIRVPPKWNLQRLLQLVRTGVPICAVGQLYMWWTTLDATLVLNYAGKRQLGLYAIAGMAAPTVGLLTSALAQVIYPKMSECYGRTASVQAIVRMCAAPIGFGLLATAAVSALAWVLLPAVAMMVLPRYVEGIPAAQWAILATAVLAFSPILNVFNVMKRQLQYSVALVSGIAVYFGALHLLMHDRVELTDFPQALLLGRVVFLGISACLIASMVRAERQRIDGQ